MLVYCLLALPQGSRHELVQLGRCMLVLVYCLLALEYCLLVSVHCLLALPQGSRHQLVQLGHCLLALWQGCQARTCAPGPPTCSVHRCRRCAGRPRLAPVVESVSRSKLIKKVSESASLSCGEAAKLTQAHQGLLSVACIIDAIEQAVYVWHLHLHLRLHHKLMLKLAACSKL